MAGKVNKKSTIKVRGILDLSDGIVKLEVEDVEEPVVLADLLKEFDGFNIQISADYSKDLA
jgi:hypothetical protein